MRKSQATSNKHQATSDKRLSKKAIKIHEAWAYQQGYRTQATSNKLQGTKVLITQPEGLRQIVARQNDAGAISRKRQATSTRIPDSGFKQQASSAKLI